MSTTGSELATAPVNPGFHKATSMLSTTLGIEPRMMVDTIKRQCFPGQNPDAISDAQLAAFISVANSLHLNPLVPGMLYAYPSKNGGIVPVTGPDGVFKMLDERITEDRLDGYDCVVFPEDVTQKPTHATATIWRKGTEHPSKYTALISEWNVSSNPNWGARPRHMLWVRALKQCARQVIHGIPFDEDEVTIGDMKDVTPEPIKRADPKPRAKTGAASVQENPAPAKSEPVTPPPVPEGAKGTVVDGELEGDPKANPVVQEVREEKKAAVPAKQVEATPKEPWAKVTPGEVATFVVEVVTVETCRKSKTDMTAVLDLTVSGGITGRVVGFGPDFATGSDKEGNPIPVAKFSVGAKLKLTLHGFQIKPGVTQTRIDAAEPVDEQKTLE